jgi:type 1 glutamine amidotransferase
MRRQTGNIPWREENISSVKEQMPEKMRTTPNFTNSIMQIKMFAFLLALLMCVTVSSEVMAQKSGKKPHLVFLINEDPLNYEAHITIPPFADSLQRTGQFTTTVLKGRGNHESFQFDGLKAIEKADVLVVFCRRVALPHKQMEMIQKYIKSGKPVVGIRTANHGFSVRSTLAVPGHEGWWGFVPDILGHENRGYEPEPLGTYVEVVPENANHPILKGISSTPWKSNGCVYKVAPIIDPKAKIILTGSTPNVKEPSAWTRVSDYGGKVFYTALGYPTDFGESQFRQLLVNGILWAADSTK